MASIASGSKRLANLQRRKTALAQQIAAETRRLRDWSRVRASIRARTIGEAVIALHEAGRLPARVIDEIKCALLAQVERRNREFEALQGSGFDVTALLHERSDPVHSSWPSNAENDRGRPLARGDGAATGSLLTERRDQGVVSMERLGSRVGVIRDPLQTDAAQRGVS